MYETQFNCQNSKYTKRLERTTVMNFYEWLHYTSPWKSKIDELHYTVFNELNITKERLEQIFEKLEQEGFFESENK